jgi:hypothetical protein
MENTHSIYADSLDSCMRRNGSQEIVIPDGAKRSSGIFLKKQSAFSKKEDSCMR